MIAASLAFQLARQAPSPQPWSAGDIPARERIARILHILHFRTAKASICFRIRHKASGHVIVGLALTGRPEKRRLLSSLGAIEAGTNNLRAASLPSELLNEPTSFSLPN